MNGVAVVVGASLAGLRAAEALRANGFVGRLVIVGAERHPPYDRPPLSKQVLSGWVRADQTELPALRPIDAEWRLGVRATRLDPNLRALSLSSGETLAYTRLIVATGARSRPWPVAGEASLAGVHVLRTQEDAGAVAAGLARGPRRVLVVGGGFTGCEVASACAARGLPVSVAEAGPAPLAAALGRLAGDHMAGLMRASGVDLRLGTAVAALQGDERGMLVGARLADGSEIEADLAVVCLGATAETEWLAGSGLDFDARGLVCDAACRALDAEGRPVEGIYGAGDAIRAHHAVIPGGPLRTEHWSSAVEQAAVAGANAARGEAATQWTALPTFWTMPFGAGLKTVGAPSLADQVVLLHGALTGGRFTVGYGRNGRFVGVLSVNQAHWLDFYTRQVEASATFPPSFQRVDPPPSDLSTLRPFDATATVLEPAP